MSISTLRMVFLTSSAPSKVIASHLSVPRVREEWQKEGLWRSKERVEDGMYIKPGHRRGFFHAMYLRYLLAWSRLVLLGEV